MLTLAQRREARLQSRRYHLPNGLLQGLLETESGGNPRAVSATGDVGLAQIHLASHPGVTRAQAQNPAFSIAWAARYLAGLRSTCKGSLVGALTQYNHGGAYRGGPCAPSPYSARVIKAAEAYGYKGTAAPAKAGGLCFAFSPWPSLVPCSSGAGVSPAKLSRSAATSAPGRAAGSAVSAVKGATSLGADIARYWWVGVLGILALILLLRPREVVV
jgi:hypothetical protein